MNRFCFLFLLILIVSCKQKETTSATKNSLEEKTLNKNPVFLFIGDSLTAGQGVASEDCWVSLLQKEFEIEKVPFQTKNAGISRETSAGTVKRIDNLIATKPKIIFLSIGSNDAFRGRSLEEYRNNLEQIILKVQKANIRIILGGTNLYLKKEIAFFQNMDDVSEELAKKYSLLLYPFLLEGITDDKTLFLRDGLHPNAKGHQIVFERLNEFFKKNLLY